MTNKSLKTVNLGLQYNIQPTSLSEQFSRSSDLFSPNVNYHASSHSNLVGSHKSANYITANHPSISAGHKGAQKLPAGDLYFAPISPSSFEHPLKSVPNYQAASPKSISPYHSASPPSGHYTSSLGTSRIKPSVHDISSTLGTYSQSQISKSISPVEGTKDLSWPPQLATQERSGKLQKSQQVLVPGDRVIFAESPSQPGLPIVYRLEEERKINPDKLNLDRRKLCVCPQLEGEESLRLLNLQHNLITRIERLAPLRKLIFLDLYDNHIEEISGIGCLRSLRVLMLGKNRIRKITNLQDLTMLDVLDLHGNKITKIENISHLNQLRILNLAGNELTTVRNLTGLDMLQELNLRRNYIEVVHDVGTLQSLRRLFLSFNEIKRYEDISCLSQCSSLIELSLDGNPISLEVNYKQIILQNVLSISQLDMKRLTDEERRIAVVMARKEEERRRESERLTSLKEKRKLAINNAQRQWDQERKENTKSALGDECEGRSSSSSVGRPSPCSIGADGTDYSVCHLAEVDNDSLNLFGRSALDAIDRNWGEKTSSSVSTITFKYIDFEAIVPHLAKLHSRFSNFQTIVFAHTSISQLNQLNALACLKHLDHLHIQPEGNAVTNLSLWKPYTIFRLAHLNLQKLNDEEISSSDMVHAEKLFGPISHKTTTLLSQTRILMLLAKQKKFGTDASHKVEKSKLDARHNRTSSGESVSKAGLIYDHLTAKEKQEDNKRKAFASSFVHDIIQNQCHIDRKRTALNKHWPSLFDQLIHNTVDKMENMNEYMENSLEHIKRSINTSVT